jgi:hypothetical protein
MIRSIPKGCNSIISDISFRAAYIATDAIQFYKRCLIEKDKLSSYDK